MQDLITERLILRTLAGTDLAAVMALAGQFRVARMLSDMPHPATSENIADWLVRRKSERRFAIVLDHQLIGSVGYFHTFWGKAELGYWLGPAWWGRGFALEAAACVIAHGGSHDDIDCFTASYFIDNPASGKVLTRLGFRQVARRRIHCPARNGPVDAIACDLQVSLPTGTRRPLKSWLPRTLRRAIQAVAP